MGVAKELHLQMPSNSSKKLVWQLIQEQLSCADAKTHSKEKRCMALILTLLFRGKLTEASLHKRMKQLYFTGIEGMEAVAWGMQMLATLEQGKERRWFLEQMDAARNQAAVMKKIRKGWMAYGMTPYEVLSHRVPPQIPRYQSEPIMCLNAL